MTGQKMKTDIFIGPTYYQRLKQMVGDKVHCLSTDHEVLTLNGWKFNHQLSMNDKIATLVDGELVYQKPNKILNYPNYKGDMYRIKTQQIDLLVTPNHRMWVSKQDNNTSEWENYDFELAENITNQCTKYKKNAIWNTNNYQFMLPGITCDNGITYPEKQVNMNSWLSFFGDQITKDLEFRDRYRYEQQVLNEYNNEQINSYMKQFNVQDKHKYLPDWVFHLSSKQARILLENIIPCFETNNEYCTSSNKFANDIMQLTLHCGWSCNKTLISDNVWRLEISKSDNTPLVDHSQSGNVIKDYDKPVFCLEVTGGVFYVRRNGKAVWTGNSRARGPTQLLTRQPPEGTMLVH